MKRKILAAGLTVVLLACSAGTSKANLGRAVPVNDGGSTQQVLDVTFMYQIRVDGQKCNAGPILWKHDRIYVQLRAFAACLGGRVDWTPEPYGVASVTFNGYGKTPVTLNFRPLIESPTMEMQEYADPPIRFNMGAYAPFTWTDDRTYLPFRYLTDAADYKTVYTAGTDGLPNEVNVYRGQHAIPADGYVISAQHVTVNEDAVEPFTLAAEPYGGWPFMPATLRALTATFAQSNWAIRTIRKDPEAKAEVVFDRANVRVDVRATNTNPMHITHYGTHFVRWFDTQTEADDYQTTLDIHNLWQGFWNTLWTAGTAGIATYLVGASATVSTAVVAPVGLASLAFWITENRADARFMQGCVTDAFNTDHKDKHRPGEPIFGILYGVQGTYCIPVYSNQALDAKGNYL